MCWRYALCYRDKGAITLRLRILKSTSYTLNMGNYPGSAQRPERYDIMMPALSESFWTRHYARRALLKVSQEWGCDWFDYVTPMKRQATPVNNDLV